MIRAKDHIILTASYEKPVPHKHLALHLLFGLEGPVECQVEGQQIVCDGICIASNVYHTASAGEGQLLMVLVETSSELAKQIRKNYLNKEDGNSVYTILPSDFVRDIRHGMKNGDTDRVEECIRTLDGHYVQADSHMDERIWEVLQWIEGQEGIDENIYRELTEVSCLSLSRLSHLFKEQTGSSLAGYLAWVKLQKAYDFILAGNNLTEAAIRAGFASSSHMSATFRRMFGITFSQFLASV